MKHRGLEMILFFTGALLAFCVQDGQAGPDTAPADAPLKSVRLVVIEAGDPGPLLLGFDVELEAGWHLYWVNPGDAGLAPNARWTLPAGFTAGPLRHPVPRKAIESGVVSLEHEGRVLLLCSIAPPPTGFPAGRWKISAVLEWMACLESCVTGESAVEAVFPPDAATLAEGRSLREGSSSRFPRSLEGSGLTLGTARAEWTGSAWLVEIPFSGPRAAEVTDLFAYPVDDFLIENSGVVCRDGKIVIPLVPSRGPGSPPPSAVSGLLVVDGAGYEISVAVSRKPVGSSLPGFTSLASWR